jgi:uncharacterized membrane protein
MEIKKSNVTAILLVSIALLTLVSVILGIFYPNFIFELLPGESNYVIGGTIYESIYILLTLATDVLYVVGGAVVFYGGVLVTVHFFQKDPDKPHTPHEIAGHLSGYLNLGLAFFIGAEIIKTVVVRTIGEFEVLILTIVARGLFSLILYLERRWHGTESE